MAAGARVRGAGGGHRVRRIERSYTTESTMPIAWQHDLDAALPEAQRAGRAVLLDFSAAPM